MKAPSAPLTARESANRSRAELSGSGAESPLGVDVTGSRGREGPTSTEAKSKIITRTMTQSASPRPQRVRAVDAVRIAKTELEKSVGPVTKVGRLRLTNLPTSYELDRSAGGPDDAAGGGPVLHEGFYNLAAAVTRPPPSLRLQAEQAIAAAFKEEANKRIQQLSNEVTELKSRLAEITESPSQTLEAAMRQVEEENLGLRRIVQHLLANEAELKQKNDELMAEVSAKEKNLNEAELQIQLLNADLEEACHQLMEQEEARNRASEDKRDGCNSPMMAFSTFVMNPDQEGSSLWGNNSAAHLSGEPPKEDHRRTLSRRVEDRSSCRRASSGRLSMFSSSPSAPSTAQRRSSKLDIPTVAGLLEANSSNNGPRKLSSRMSQDSSSPIPTFQLSKKASSLRRKSTARQQDSSGDDVVSSPGRKSTAKQKELSPDEEEEEIASSDDDDDPTRRQLASAFPALLPFLDFSKVDHDAAAIKAGTLTQNFEHLEKHMIRLKDEHHQQEQLNISLQKIVDRILQKLLIWVQAVWDSMNDFGASSIKQDAQAMAEVREMLAWLAKRSCKDWLDPLANLEKVLEVHEERLRAALAACTETVVSPEAEELRKTLEAQRKYAQELEEKLQEAERKALLSPTRKSNLSSQQPDGGLSRESDFLSKPEELDAIEEEAEERRESLIGKPIETASPLGRFMQSRPLSKESPRVTTRGTRSSTSSKEVLSTAEEIDQGALSGRSAAEELEAEARKMRLLRSSFAEAIDLTMIPRSSQVLLRMPAELHRSDGTSEEDGKSQLGLKQLRALIVDVYAAKRQDDQRRDKAREARRPIHFALQELLRLQHGIRKVVNQRCYQLLESVVNHSSSDASIALFADFLDGTRDLDELSFFLYCSSLMVSAVTEESQAHPPGKFMTGIVSLPRALRLVELLFGDLPKALAIVKAELEKCVGRPLDSLVSQNSVTSFEDWSSSAEGFGTTSKHSIGVDVNDLCRTLLDGWRASALLLDRSVSNFSWRETVLAFMQEDVFFRGWLDPHQVRQAESRPSLAGIATTSNFSQLQLGNQTSLGAFVFRTVNRRGGHSSKAAVAADTLSPLFPSSANSRRKLEAEALLKVSSAAFNSIEKSLGVYLSWLLHSEEMRDLAVYQSLKSRIYNFRCATSNSATLPSVHNIRCLVLLLLGHQFDMQLQREEASVEHIGWELTGLLNILRENWRRGASAGVVDTGPDFGAELDEEINLDLMPEMEDHE